MPNGKPFVGIDLGGTNMQVGVVNGSDKAISRIKKKTKADEGRDIVIDRIVRAIEEACAGAKLTVAQLGGVGIGAPGAVDSSQGVVLEAVNLRWDDVPLAKILRQKLGVPVYLDNDVNVAVYGENELGAGNHARDLLGVWAGTGIGGGLILNGELYYGGFLTAGEIGHVVLFPNNPSGWRSLEHACARTAVVERILRLIRANRKSIVLDLADGDPAKVKSETIARAYEKGDALTVEVVDQAADLLGVAIASVVTLLSLPRVVLGGGLTEALGRPFVDRVQRSCRASVFPDRCRKVEVVASKLEDQAGLLGAALLARKHLS